MITPEKRLLEAIVKQAIKDYIKLNPSSNLLSAEFFENEAADFKTAEDFLFNNTYFEFGDWKLNFEECCLILNVEEKEIKKFIFKKQRHF